MQFEQARRNRAAERDRDWDRCHEAGRDPPPVDRREPVGEEQDHAREKTGLGEAEQKTDEVKAPFADDECRGTGNQPPADHDAGDPQPRADLVEDDVARHFEQEIAEKECGPRTQAESGLAEAQILAHGQRSETDIHPVDLADQIQQSREGQDAPINLSHRPLLDGPGHPAPPDTFVYRQTLPSARRFPPGPSPNHSRPV